MELVTVRNIVTGETDEVTPEVANVIRNQNQGDWRIDKDAEIDELKARIAELEDQVDALEHEDPDGTEMPKTAKPLIAWIGDDHNRALAAKTVEDDLGTPRKSVLDHIESVLNPKNKEA